VCKNGGRAHCGGRGESKNAAPLVRCATSASCSLNGDNGRGHNGGSGSAVTRFQCGIIMAQGGAQQARCRGPS
jgi:hypothetical protein